MYVSESIFDGFDDGEVAATKAQLQDEVSIDEVEMMLALKLSGGIGQARQVLRNADTHSRGELDEANFRRSIQRFGIVLSEPELEALVGFVFWYFQEY